MGGVGEFVLILCRGCGYKGIGLSGVMVVYAFVLSCG